ncbi:MAG: response regulator [Tildeniella nuda ZEHNDER 1965/U140]|jgi:CheY-like chemotaxis protein|nr:response regulator [Tildeniella nuda ZEHNDER 1965/U140]
MPTSKQNFAAKRILLIDHEVNVRAVVQTCLSVLGGWEVLIAESNQAGLSQAILQQPDLAILQQPDLIILDPSVSEQINGLALLEHLKAHPATRLIPVILLSAEVRWLNAQQLQQLGVVGAIAKPFHAPTLPAQIAALVGWV